MKRILLNVFLGLALLAQGCAVYQPYGYGAYAGGYQPYYGYGSYYGYRPYGGAYYGYRPYAGYAYRAPVVGVYGGAYRHGWGGGYVARGGWGGGGWGGHRR